MTTGLGLVTSIMRKIGAITKNETPSSDEANDGIEIINDILSSWSNDSAKVYTNVLENFTLTPGDGEYTIGTGANFNTARPIKILKAYTRSGTIDTPLKIISDENFARITVKSQVGPADCLNYNPSFPSGTIKIWPVPSTADTLYLLSEKELTSITLAGTVSFPPGWKRALIYNGAIDFASEYGQPVTAEIAEIAAESKAAIMRGVMKTHSLDVPGFIRSDTIYTGWR